MTFQQIEGLYNYWIVIFLMMTGFYIVLARRNLIKSVIGLNIFQTSVFLLYITMGKVRGGTAPIIPAEVMKSISHDVHETAIRAIDATEPAVPEVLYSNPLPSVLMLTAIVVGVATTALALALVVRIREDYGSLDEEQILKMDRDES